MNKNAIEIASKNLVTIDIGEPIGNADKLMQNRRIRHLVVTHEGKALGILSDRDVIRALRVDVQDFHSVRVREQRFEGDIFVGDVMSWPVKTVDEKVPLTEILDEMLEHKISSFLVTREGAGAVGIVTTEDLLQVLKRILIQGKTAEIEEAHPWLAEVYQSPIGQILGMLSNSGI